MPGSVGELEVHVGVPQWVGEGLLPLVARVLLTVEFCIAALGKVFDWKGQAAYMASHGMFVAPPLLRAAVLIEIVGSACLITGPGARGAAGVMFVYLGIVSVQLHDFWNQVGAATGTNQAESFKNPGIMGGLLPVARHGPGMWALGGSGGRAREEALACLSCKPRRSRKRARRLPAACPPHKPTADR